MSIPHPLRILSVEGDPKNRELIQGLLDTEGIVCELTRVDTQAALLASLERGGIDLVLADYTLPSFDGISALKFAVKTRPEVPFILVSGTLGEEVANRSAQTWRNRLRSEDASVEACAVGAASVA